ncbi:MAG TPA: hypothetical protein H9664_04380 [Firmicutes bacterium]|nr:hypothetical protein [Bacillota bacterium]
MARNKVKFHYALRIGQEQLEDEYGNITGEYAPLYSNPVEWTANISAAQGETETRQFGESEEYDKVIVMDGSAPPIDEYSVLWVDTTPKLNPDGSLAKDGAGHMETPYDYDVKRVAKSLNSISVAVKKVNVS